MDDAALQRFFTHHTSASHRQYEALRAVVVDGLSQKQAADAFGFQYASLRQLMHGLRRTLDDPAAGVGTPFFKPEAGRSRRRPVAPRRSSPTGRR